MKASWQLHSVRQLFEYMTGLDTRIGYPNEHLGRSKHDIVKSPMYATSVGLVLSGYRALDERENRYLEKKMSSQNTYSNTKGTKKVLNAQGGDFFKKILDKTKGLLMDDFNDEKNDY